MPPKKNNVATGKKPEQHVQEALSPFTVLRQPVSQLRPQTSQSSDASEDAPSHDTEATPTSGSADPSIPSNPSISFTERFTSGDMNPQYLEMVQQMQQQMQQQMKEQMQQQMQQQQEMQERMQQQMQQNLLQVIERMTPSSQTFAQTPAAETHQTAETQENQIHRRIQRLQENARIIRSTYDKVKLINNQDWSRWNTNLRDYINALRINSILDEEYDIPNLNNPEKQLYDAQDTILQTFLRITVDQKHLHLLKGVATATKQYQTVKTHLDLGIHAQIFYAAKKLQTLKFITFEEYATVYISCINQICDTRIITFREIAPYLFMVSI